MRHRLSLAALASAYIFGSSSAALAEVSGVTASANGWDIRTAGYGCSPSGCVADNVLDASIEPESRWSCRATTSNIDVCQLTFVFDEPQDIFEMRMAMFKGNERIRTVNIWVDGVFLSMVETSGTTLEYEPYELTATQATTIVLEAAGMEDNGWLSITGVQIMTDSEVDVPSPSPTPTGDDYVGCYNDMVGDRVLTTVTTDDALTPADCAATCGEMTKYFYGLQQGNECWCAGCDITERDTNTDYDRNGEGSCSTPCAGDSTSTCGGDMAISLYQTTTCLATPAPTPAIPSSECPSGSTEASLEITVSWEGVYSGLDLHVVEPGGVEVYWSNKLGDVGMWGDGRDGYGDISGSETYLLLNGLSVGDDAVLGDYEVWATDGREDGTWTITARSGGELLWIGGGEFSEFQDETDRFTATVTAYAESDCTIDAYGECPRNSYGSDGLPPCTSCASGLVSTGGSSFCTVSALRNLDLPENIASAMVADAVGGWAGPGDAELNDGNEFYKLFVIEGEEAGTAIVSGNFTRDDGAALPASTALYLYVHNEDSENDFVRGQGEIDPTTGDFTATVTDIVVGWSRAILSFVVLDPADTPDDSGADTVFDLDVMNEGCSDALRIKLEWDSNDDLDLWVTDPNGDRVTYAQKATDIGYLNNRNGGGLSAGNPDTGFASSFEEYVVFSGLFGDAMLGEYRVFAKRDYAPSPNAWTLTATINGAVVWVEEGVFDGSSSTFDDDYTDDTTDDSTASRRLYTSFYYHDDDDSSYTSYSSTYAPRTDVFTITLDSYDAAGC